MLGILKNFFNSNEQEIQRLQPLIARINDLEKETKKYALKDFPKITAKFKERIQKGESLDNILPEAFALVREASVRTVGMKHFDVQLMAAVTLSRGAIAEQKTGEGKTLSAVPALYLNALTGKSVHLVTVNDYLARRDAGWMGPIFHLLGMRVASMISDQSFEYDPSFDNQGASDYRLTHLRPIERQEAYKADVVYGINSEFGFDYLRDNMVQDVKSLSQRDFYFAIVDEVDSVLIDEARTPHIISAPDESPSAKYYEYAKLVDKLSSSIDYKVDEKFRTAHLTDHGIGKIEKLYGVANIYEKDFDTVYHLEAALKARTLFHKEKDYIVKDNQVILVDEFTGRLLEGRRLSEGLHQAIEAKENVPIQRESKTLATVSLQNYFRKYEKLSGMTGTALTESEEFKKIYNLDVVVIPTNNNVTRKDLSDAVYKSVRAKFTAVAVAIEEAHKRGQPVLVGTTSIDKNEIISQLLTRKGIKHAVLNAKNHLKEAEIISEAGKKGAVTVATNMAGRGVDIILGGEVPKKEDGTTAVNSPEWKAWKKQHDEVLSLGGLYVIGTERHESRRIDNQLRGRSGRQGDPGTSHFFVSLEDDIMRLFGGDRISGIMTRFNMPDDVPLEHPLVSKAIENAQVKVEKFHFDGRKHLLEYDDVLNKQREIVYTLRRGILLSQENKDGSSKDILSLKDEVTNRIRQSIASIVSMRMEEQKVQGMDANANKQIIEDFVTIIPFDDNSQKQLLTQIEQEHDIEGKTAFLEKLALDLYDKREKDFGEDLTRQVEKHVMLTTIDNLWMSHLDIIKHLEEGIRLQAYAQKDPLVEYKNEAFRLFEKLIFAMDDEIVHRVYKYFPANVGEGANQHVHMVTNRPEGEISVELQAQNNSKQKAKQRGREIQQSSALSSASVSDVKHKLGRNDPCWCGSGKKWKKCHYPEVG